jgi:cell division protein FtsL
MTSAIGMNRAVKGRYAQIGACSGSACRISVRPNVLLPYGDLDENDVPVIKRRPVRRAPPMHSNAIAAPRHERPVQRGLSFTTALCIVGFFVFLLGIITLVNTSRMTEKAKSLNSLRSQIEAGQKENDELAMQLDEKSDGAKICYTAARELGMVSAEGADVVYLTAPATRKDLENVQSAIPQARTGIYATLFGFLD